MMELSRGIEIKLIDPRGKYQVGLKSPWTVSFLPSAGPDGPVLGGESYVQESPGPLL